MTAPEVSTPFGGAASRECESCRSAPGIPFCRVEWSFLCTGCAAVVHGHNWIVSMPSNPNPNAIAYPYPFSNLHDFPNPSPGPCPCPNPNPTAGTNQVVQLSSDEDDPSSAEPGEDNIGSGGERKRRRRSGEGELPLDRAASMMRYKKKRNSRNFDKTVRYEKRKVYADSRPRIDGKFAKVADIGEGQTGSSENGDHPILESCQNARIEADNSRSRIDAEFTKAAMTAEGQSSSLDNRDHLILDSRQNASNAANKETAETFVDQQLGDVEEEVNADATFAQLLDGGLELGLIGAGEGVRLP